MAAALARLAKPWEILDLPDRGSVRLRIRSWERGTMLIHPRYEGAPVEKEIEALRLHVPPEVKPYPPHYYDVTSTTLMPQILPDLYAGDYTKYEYVITKFGVAPRARFTLERIPL